MKPEYITRHMKNNKQTAVEWLYNHLFPKELDGFSSEEWDKIDKAFEQAKAMENEQIINSYNEGYGIRDAYGDCSDNQTAEQYYNELYNK